MNITGCVCGVEGGCINDALVKRMHCEAGRTKLVELCIGPRTSCM